MVINALENLAWLVLGLFAGAWMDRIRCRGVMIAGDLARAAIFASVPIAHLAGVLSLPQLFVVALAAGIGTVFFDVASTTLLPRLVSTRDLVAANSRLATETVPDHPRRPRLWRDVAEGWRFVARHSVLRALAGYSARTVFFQAMEGAVSILWIVASPLRRERDTEGGSAPATGRTP